MVNYKKIDSPSRVLNNDLLTFLLFAMTEKL